MFWKKKKKMVDIREFHKRGMQIPDKDVMVTTNKDGFVEMPSNQPETEMPEPKTMFSFFDKPETTTPTTSPVQTTSTDDIRKLTERLERLDNTLYKLEQRIELLERKAGVSSSDGGVSTGALIGW